MSGTSDPTTDPRVTKTLQGVRDIEHRGTGQNQLLPITKPILHALLGAIPFCLNSSYQQHMFRALFLLCFYSCLPVGEAVHSTSTTHTLTVSQVTSFSGDHIFAHCFNEVVSLRIVFMCSWRKAGTPQGADQFHIDPCRSRRFLYSETCL